jgi:hypothetical protein
MMMMTTIMTQSAGGCKVLSSQGVDFWFSRIAAQGGDQLQEITHKITVFYIFNV